MPNHAIIIITGHIGKVEELKYLPKGDAVLRFSLAVNTGYNDSKTCSWYDVSLFGKRAEKLSQMLRKGDPITAIGEPVIRKWESNGKGGTSVSVRASEIVLLGGKPTADQAHEAESQPRETSAEQQDDSGNVPF